MNNLEIKILLAKEVLSQIGNKSIENTIREIIFNSANNIDWTQAERTIRKNMPELTMK